MQDLNELKEHIDNNLRHLNLKLEALYRIGEKRIVNTTKLAEILDVSTQKVDQWRKLKKNPLPSIEREGEHPRYHVQECIEWLKNPPNKVKLSKKGVV